MAKKDIDISKVFSGATLEDMDKILVKKVERQPKVTIYDTIINTFVSSERLSDTIPVEKEPITKTVTPERARSPENVGNEYIVNEYKIKGTDTVISPVTLRKKAKANNVYAFTKGETIGLVKIVDETKEWFKEHNIDTDEYLGKPKPAQARRQATKP